MNDDVLFLEKQKFNQWWLWLILIGSNGFLLFEIVNLIVENKQIGSEKSSIAILLFALLYTSLLTLAFVYFSLDTIIKQDGVYVRFFPLQIKYKHYTWVSIKRAYIRKYSPILEYGGWGIRYSIFGKGKAYNISGNYGLQLELMDTKKILIGTNKPEELTKVLHDTGHNNN